MKRKSDSIPVTIYGHRRKNDGRYVYVGATTTLEARWRIEAHSPVDVVLLEEADLGHQVERESYWIRKLRAEGHPLTNSREPKRIVSPRTTLMDEGPDPSPTLPYCYEFPRPSVTVDAVVFGVEGRALNVLMIKRALAPFRGRWAFPGGFLNMSESLEDGVRRELWEETSVKPAHLEQLYTFGNPGRDPRGRVISVAYMALVRSSSHSLQASSDASDARWFFVDELRRKRLAFDHESVLDLALARLQAKIRYAPIGFDLLPESFSLVRLQALYEAVLGKELDKRNFRKKILKTGLLRETGGFSNTIPRAKLYRFDQDEYERLTKLGFNFEL